MYPDGMSDTFLDGAIAIATTQRTSSPFRGRLSNMARRTVARCLNKLKAVAETKAFGGAWDCIVHPWLDSVSTLLPEVDLSFCAEAPDQHVNDMNDQVPFHEPAVSSVSCNPFYGTRLCHMKEMARRRMKLRHRISHRTGA